MIEEIQKVWHYFTPWSWEFITAKCLLIVCVVIVGHGLINSFKGGRF